MAVERLVTNTGPLIALTRANALEVAGRLPFRIICPPQVRAELDAGLTEGHERIQPSWLTIEPLERPLEPVARVTLGAGEAAVIQLALEQGIQRVCIDERRGRRTANAVGLQVVGTLGLLLRAKTEGIIPAVRPYIERLTQTGDWYYPDLIRTVLQGAGEA